MVLKFKIPIPVIILGSPIPGSENPFLVSPIAYVIVNLDFRECVNPSLEVSGFKDLEGMLEAFWSKLNKGLSLNLCSKLNLHSLDGVGRAPLGGLYASLTSLMLYALHKLHGDIAQVLDVIETTSLIDLVNVDVSWKVVLEALRYSALTGKPVAYRGPLEAYVFEEVEWVKATIGSRVEGVKSMVSRENLGFNVYGALVHLMGEAVLEASLRIKEGSSLRDILNVFKLIHDGVTLAVYNLKPTGEKCLWSPSIPWSFDEVCLVD